MNYNELGAKEILKSTTRKTNKFHWARTWVKVLQFWSEKPRSLGWI